MAKIGYKGALGGMAKDAISGAGNALVGGLKGAVLREMPAVSAGMAFGKELSKRANAPKMKSGDTPPPVNEQTSTSPAMGGFGASVSLVAGQNKSNVINLEQVRQLKQLNDSVITQSKLIAFQIADQKRKDQFAEESANEQAVRDDALLNAIKNIGGGGEGGRKGKGDGNEKGGGLGILGDAAASAAGGAAGSWLKSIGLAIISGVTTAAVAAFAFFRNSILSLARNLVLSAALRFGPMAGAGATAAAGAVTISAASIAAIAALIAGLLYSKDAGAAKGKDADTINGRDAANDPKGAARRRAAEDATQKRVPSRQMVSDTAKWWLGEKRADKEAQWDEKYGKTHDPVTGLLKDPKASTIYTPPAAGRVTSNFGEIRKDATGKETTHQGVDIAMASGTPVRPIAPGKVTRVQTSGDAGTYVQVTHPDGKISEYMHLSKALAKVNDDVTLTSVIGESGGAKDDKGAGKSTGPHLHLQLKDASGAFINPSTVPGLAGLTKGEKVSPADNTPKISARDAVDDTGKQKHTGPKISNSEAENYLKGLGVGAGGSTSNVGIVDKDLIANKIADRMDAEAGANTIGTGGVKSRGVSISDALRGLSAEEIAAMIPDFSRRYPGIQLAAGPGFKLGGGGGDWDGEDRIVAKGVDRSMGGGTGLKFKKEPTDVIDKANLEVNKKQLAQAKTQEKSGSALSTKEANDGIARQTKALKPLFRNNSDIIADTNKTFLNQFRSTATGIFTQAITKGLFPKGFGVSAAEAGRDDNYRGQQLQKIFGTDKVINEATTKLLGKQYGPMFAPLFNNLAQGYLEVGSRIAGRTVFQDLSKFGIGGLGAKETQELTGQIFGNFAAGNKKLALEQLLYGASGGKESGIALGPETLFAKYGFKNPAEGIQYFSSVLGEQVTQPFSKLMGADDRSKSIVWNPKAGKNGTGAYVYVDSGREASQEDINKMGNYGAPVNPTSVSNALGDYNNFRDPYGPGGPRNIVNGTYTSAGAASAYRQVVDPDTGKLVAPTKREILGMSRQEYMRDEKGNEQKADITIQLMREDADKKAKFHAETLGAAREAEAKRLEAAGEAQKASEIRSRIEIEKNEIITKQGSDSIVVAVESAAGTGGKGGGTEIEDKDGKKKSPSLRKSGQLFGADGFDENGKPIMSGMKEIGNFAFDMAKNAAGSALTKDIKNPYMQMIANFAIQKGMNMGIDYLMKSGGIGDTLMNGAGKWLGDAASSAGNWIVDTALPGITSWFSGLFADGGPVTGPGTGRSDSIPAMLSNGEFVVNAAASKKYRPLLDALNYTKYADGTTSAPGSVNALSKALGTDKQLNALGSQTDLLTSIDNSLLYLSGGGGGSGTSFSSYGGTAFDVGLGSPSGGSISSGGGGGNTVRGVSRSRPTQQGPSTMDYVTAIGGSMLKSFAINQAVGMASTALFGATPGVLAGNALVAAGFPTLGGMLGGTAAFTGTGLTAGAGGIGLTAGSGAVGAAGMGGGTGLVAGSNALGGTLGTSAAASGTGSLLAAETVGTTTAAAGGTLGTIGSSLVAAAPYLLAAVAVFMIFDSYGGGGGGGPPPKEPKFHAAIYVAGNNNISAIATILETTDYHAVPDVYKTVAYGLLKVAFNATKTSEAVSKTAPPYDWVYVKVQFDRVSLLWGKGAPNASSIIDDSATEVKRWPALEESTNLNAYASDILALVRDEFKKSAKADQMDRLDKTASALGDYSLHTLSSGLVQDLKSGNYALDTSIEKGVFADNVAESARISELIRAAEAKKAYLSDPTIESVDDTTGVVTPASAGKQMIYSLKDNAFVENKYPGALILDSGGRPVYDIEGTSAGLSVEDFVSSSVAGANRPANILAPPPTPTGAGGAGGTNNTVVKGPTIDNSQVTTFVNSLTTVTDVVRSSTTQVGLIG